MAQPMTGLPMLWRFDRNRWMAVVDWLAVAVAVSLPWSTSVTAILVTLWILAMLPTLDAAAVRRELANPAAYLPVLLWVLAAIGMLWAADVSWHDRIGGLGKFHRLLVIPLLLIHFRRSERGIWVIYGFFGASVALLLVSWVLVLTPGLTWRGKDFGVPAKDYIFQSMNFLICVFALLGFACETGRVRQWRRAVGAVVLALLFVANMFFVVTSRTALLVVPVLLVWLGWQEFRWRGLFGTLLLFVVVGSAAWSASPYLHDRLTRSVAEYEAYRTQNEPNSTGLHLEFLRKSLNFVETAPIIGHGTGSIPDAIPPVGNRSRQRLRVPFGKSAQSDFRGGDSARRGRECCADRDVDRASLIVYGRQRLGRLDRHHRRGAEHRVVAVQLAPVRFHLRLALRVRRRRGRRNGVAAERSGQRYSARAAAGRGQESRFLKIRPYCRGRNSNFSISM